MDESRMIHILQENYDCKISDIAFNRDGGGRTYIVNGEGQKFFLKVAGKAFQDTIRQSVDVACYLSQMDFPVPAIIFTKTGMPLLEVIEEEQEYLFILNEYIEGKEPNLNVCGERVGALIGRLHTLLSGYDKSKLLKRDAQFFIKRYVDILHRKNYPHTETYSNLGNQLWDRVTHCHVDVCHGDLHRGNLLETVDGKIYLLDFDTICTAPRMFDVMVMCDMTDYFHLQSDDIKTTKAVYETFLKGYTRHVHLTETEQESFYDWVAIRHFQLQAAIVEIYGIDCIDHNFMDKQLHWLTCWSEQMCDIS